MGSQEEYAQDFKTALLNGALVSLAGILDLAQNFSPCWGLNPHPSYAERADLWYRETFPANTETIFYQAGYWTGIIGMDILACRAGTSAVELVTNSWKSASRFSETRKALELIERYDQPVYSSGFNFEKSSTYNRAAFEEYKVTLRAEMEKPHVVDPKLKDYADLNYKPNASIGSGSTTVGIRHELTTGEKVHNKLHSQKGREMIKVLEKWLIQMHDR